MEFQVAYHTCLRQYRFKHLAMYHAIRQAIVEGTLAEGMKLPSSRELAQLYFLSRGSANLVYEMLASEGYVHSRVGQGTFVSFCEQAPAVRSGGDPEAALSPWGQRIRGVPSRAFDHDAGQDRIDFGQSGMPDLAYFPAASFNRAMFAQVREASARPFQEPHAVQGNLSLRRSIAQMLGRTRGITASADELVIVNGSMQAIALLAQLLAGEGDRVIVEDPGHVGTRQAIEAAGGKAIPEAVDENGILVRDWASRLLFVTPARQYPTGAVLSLERRQRLLQWASARRAWIVEDDYDSQFRRKGRPIEPLKVLDRERRVIFIGSFSKTLLPDLRVGYAVLPPSLVDPFCKAKRLFEPYPAAIMEQRAVAMFIRSGEYERHVRRMRRIYAKKYELFFGLLKDKLSRRFDWVDSEAGLHVFGWWKGTEPEFQAYWDECREAGVNWRDARPYFARRPLPAGCFGFAHLTEEQIVEGAGRLAAALDRIGGNR